MGRGPEKPQRSWIPACAGMTARQPSADWLRLAHLSPVPGGTYKELDVKSYHPCLLTFSEKLASRAILSFTHRGGDSHPFVLPSRFLGFRKVPKEIGPSRFCRWAAHAERCLGLLSPLLLLAQSDKSQGFGADPQGAPERTSTAGTTLTAAAQSSSSPLDLTSESGKFCCHAPIAN
jgi:hypothetical protein